MNEKEKAINDKIMSIDDEKMEKFLEVYPDQSALFTLLGTTCNRDCSTCVLNTGDNIEDENPVTEADIIANSALTLKLDYVIIRSKPILIQPDNGAFPLRNSIKEVRKYNPNTKIEVVLPDLKAEEALMDIIIEENPDIITYYIDDVNSDTDISDKLNTLSYIKYNNEDIITKSGFKIGENSDKNIIENILDQLAKSGVDIIVIEDSSNNTPESCNYSDFYKNLEKNNNIRIFCSNDALDFKNAKKVYDKYNIRE